MHNTYGRTNCSMEHAQCQIYLTLRRSLDLFFSCYRINNLTCGGLRIFRNVNPMCLLCVHQSERKWLKKRNEKKICLNWQNTPRNLPSRNKNLDPNSYYGHVGVHTSNQPCELISWDYIIVLRRARDSCSICISNVNSFGATPNPTSPWRPLDISHGIFGKKTLCILALEFDFSQLQCHSLISLGWTE